MVSQDANDLELYQPMVAALLATLTAAGIPAALIGQVLADAGYWSQANATSFDWRFGRTELDELLQRIDIYRPDDPALVA